MSFNFTINGVTTSDKMFGNMSNVSIANAFRNIGNHFQGVAVGSITEAVTLNSGPVRATGTITIATGNMSNTDTITINSVVLEALTTPTTAQTFKVGSSAFLTAVALNACINANSQLIGVTSTLANGPTSSTTLTVSANGAGTAGNYAWSQSGSNVTLAGASAMSGGANGPVSATGLLTSTGTATNSDTGTVCNQTLTAKTSGAVPANGEFNISATVATQAANIAKAINAIPALKNTVTATSLAGVTTITAVLPGTTGNGFQLASSLTNVTATAFAGGTDAVVVTLHKGI